METEPMIAQIAEDYDCSRAQAWSRLKQHNESKRNDHIHFPVPRLKHRTGPNETIIAFQAGSHVTYGSIPTSNIEPKHLHRQGITQ